MGVTPSAAAPRRRREQYLRSAVLLGFVSVFGAFFLLGLQHELTFSALKMRQHELTALYEQRPLLVACAFFSISAALAALLIPGAVLVMSLAAGAIFGLWVGTAIQSFALAVGASIAFLGARYLLRDFVAAHFPVQLRLRSRACNGATGLLSLRLIPPLPFFVVNFAMALTTIRLRKFYLFTQIGIVPTTIIYVNAGRQLGTIKSVADVASARTIGTLALLAAVSLIPKLVAPAQGGQTNFAAARSVKRERRARGELRSSNPGQPMRASVRHSAGS